MRPSFWHYLHIVVMVRFSIACGGQSSVLARCGLTRRTFSPSRRTTWGMYSTSSWTRAWWMAGSSPGVRCACPQTTRFPALALLLCARPGCLCVPRTWAHVGKQTSARAPRRGAAWRDGHRRQHGEQQRDWHLSCHLAFTPSRHPCLRLSLSLSLTLSRSAPTERSRPHALISPTLTLSPTFTLTLTSHVSLLAAHPHPQPQPQLVRSLVWPNFTH